MNIICVIPARGGSTRIPHKNIKNFMGKPLIAYSIEKAIESEIFSRVIVSTDDDDIAQTAKKYGAEIPFKRDADLADNFTPSKEAVKDAYLRVKDDGKNKSPIDAVCCIYATAPMMAVSDLREAYKEFMVSKADYLYSCCEFPFPVQRAVYLDDNNKPHPFMPDCMPMRSQDLTPAYQDAAQFYFHSTANLTLGRQEIIRAFPIPRFRVCDIDTPEDFELARALFTALKELKRV